MAMITSKEPFQLRNRRRRRGTLSTSLALTGMFLTVVAVLQSIASIIQTQRYLSQIVLEEESRIRQRGISLHNVVRLEQGMKVEQMAVLAHGDEEEEDYVSYNRPSQKELEKIAHEMEHGGDEMTLYGLAQKLLAATRAKEETIPAGVFPARKALPLDVQLRAARDKEHGQDEMELYRLEQEQKQKLAETPREKPAHAVIKSVDKQEVNTSDSKEKKGGNPEQAQQMVSNGKTTQHASSNLSPGLLSYQLLNVNASVLKCSPWEVNIDNWWQNHPDWEPSIENDTHTCLSPIANPERAEFYRQVHAQQFPELFSEDHYYKCSTKPGPGKMALRRVANHGFASYVGHTLTESLWSAWRDNRTFHYVHPDQRFRWMYVPENRSSWAWCPSQDHECYFLPISSCDRPPAGSRQELPKKKYLWGDTEPNRTLWEQNIWLSHYIMRPRQELRRHFYEFWKQSDIPQLDEPCTWIHVRRGDAMTEAGYERNFYPIQEYLTRGEVDKGDTILLLTDDQSAIEEATLLHPEYKWVYWNRTRNRGPSAYNSHIPSQDAVLEVMIILAERKLASQCRKGVFGKSNMARMIRNAVVMARGPTNLTMVPIDWKLKRDPIDAEAFMKELDDKLKAVGNRPMEVGE